MSTLNGWSRTDLAVDHTLSLLSDDMPFLGEVTPQDVEEHRAGFLAGQVDEPRFTYAELEQDPGVLAEQLDQLPVDRVQDEMLAGLVRHKVAEMRRELEMLRMRGTPIFRDLSVELYGDVSDELRDIAQHLVDDLVVPDPSAETVGAEEIRRAADEEIDRHRQVDPRIRVHTEVRPDVSGVALDGDRLLISRDARVPAHRLESLVRHELGTHLVTQLNAAGQPLRLLRSGLADFDETHEGLAVLGELASGALSPFRLRELAVRALTVHRMLEGATFRESFTAMTDVGVPPVAAYGTCVRAYRSGGLTKDAIYLRGLLELLAHVRDGGSFDLLLLGKFALDDLPLVADLHRRGLLAPVRVTPSWMDLPDADARIRAAATAHDLCRLVGQEPQAAD